jgi:hypothetical protein
MSYRGNQPLLAQAMAPYTGQATSGQSYIPVPGGVVPGMNIVGVGGAWLAPGDFSDLDGAGISLTVPMAAGTQWIVIAFSQNTSYVPVGGQLAGFRNQLINGNFDFWQRGTSLSAGTGARYIADRWKTNSIGSTIAPSQQAFALGQTEVPGEPRYFHRAVVASSAGSGNLAVIQQLLEGVRSLAGQQAVLSFLAKADAAKNIAVELAQNFATGGSPSAQVTGIGAQQVSLTTIWKQFKVPVTIPSISGKTLGTNGDDSVELTFWLDAGSSFNARSANLGQQSGTFDIAQVQLEVGSVATQFERRPLATELALCQRYYWRRTAVGTNEAFGAAGFAYGTTNVHAEVKLPVPMRATPTVGASNIGAFSSAGASVLANTITNSGSNADVLAFNLAMSSASFTAGNGTNACLMSAGAWIDASAEL